MSKITIEPNQSGTGVFTLASPNSDTDRTLNLPDKAGTVQVGEGIDDNATSTALTIESSGDVTTTGSINANGHIALGASGGTQYIAFEGALEIQADSVGPRMVIDSSGNVSIGTSSSGSAGLSVGADLNIGWIQSAGESLANMFRQSSSGALILAQGYERSSTANGFASSYSSSLSRTAVSLSNSIKFYADTASTVAVGTDITPTERMRIDANGNLLVGTTSGSYHKIFKSNAGNYALQVHNQSTSSPYVLALTTAASSGSSAYFIVCADNANRFLVNGNGDCLNVNNSYGATSDARLKSDIADARPQLDDIMAMQVRSYTLNETGETHIGVVAQELEASGMSGLVDEDEEGTKSVKYSVLYMKAIKALQEAVTRIETLEAEVAALKAGD